MKSAKEVLAALGGLVSAHMGRELKSPFVASSGSGDVLEVTVRDQEDGKSRRFRLTAEEIDPATNAPFQPQASEGCCDTECSGEGAEAQAQSDATEDGQGCCGGTCDEKAASAAQ